MPRRPDPTERRRKELLSAATELFARKTFHGASMGDLAAVTETNKGTLYHYFESKSEILYSILEMVADAIAAKLEMYPADVPAPDRVRSLIRAQLEVNVELPLAVRVYYRELTTLDDWMPAKPLENIRARESMFVNYFTAAISRGIDEGHFRQVDPKATAFGVIGLGAWASTWYDPTGAITISDLANLYGDMVIHGLGI
jgi:TetR/AcrR family transcriptional regulator, cholesterol catabolism regulator